jgi:hypothetical protein
MSNRQKKNFIVLTSRRVEINYHLYQVFLFLMMQGEKCVFGPACLLSGGRGFLSFLAESQKRHGIVSSIFGEIIQTSDFLCQLIFSDQKWKSKI